MNKNDNETRLRFYNARILTMRDGDEIFEGELHVEGNRISYVGPGKETDASLFHREIDLTGNLIIPGFKNAHTHSPMTFLRSYADDMPLGDWLTKQVFPMEAKLNGGFVQTLTKLAVMEYLTSGITSFFDMYMFPEDIAKAAAECGFRAVIQPNLNNFSGDVGSVEELINRLNDYHPLVTAKLSFHAEYTCSKELLTELKEISQRNKWPVYFHNSETQDEVRQCINRYGVTPTVLFESLGLLENGGAAFHCVHVTDEDLDIIKNRDLHVVTNPASNLKLASGVAPIGRMLDRGICVSIGTDGPASNNSLDMFKEMFLVTALQKYNQQDAAALDAGTVLKMATTNGAYAMGLMEADILAPGKLADLAVIGLDEPNMQPLNNIAKNIVYSGSKKNVRLTMVDGKILYENGEFYIGVQPKDIYREANEIIAALSSNWLRTLL